MHSAIRNFNVHIFEAGALRLRSGPPLCGSAGRARSNGPGDAFAVLHTLFSLPGMANERAKREKATRGVFIRGAYEEDTQKRREKVRDSARMKNLRFPLIPLIH